MKKYTIDLMYIVALYDHYEISEQDIGIAYIIRELWDEVDRGYHFTKEEVLKQFPHFKRSFDILLEQGIITEMEL